MAKKVHGICCICGQDTELTFEHIPPRAAFNHFSLKLYDFWGYLLSNRTRYKQLQKGAGMYSLCESCNNLTGEWYGAAYAEFAAQGMRYYKNKAQGLLSVSYTIYPLRVLKQVVSCFASANGPFWCQEHPSIREFLLNPEERRFPSNIDIRMYMQSNGRSKIDKVSGKMNPFTGEKFVGSEFAYPPFGFICVIDRKMTSYRVLNELYPLLEFLKYGYKDRVQLYLKLPRKPCNPTILDFREGVPDVATLIEKNKQDI